jgi:hypothetical protein
MNSAAVAGAAARFRRYRSRQGDMAALELVGAYAQRGDGPFDRRVAQPPGGGQALAEPDDPRKGVDHGKAVTLRSRDQQAAIVGAEVERGEMPCRAPARCRRAGREPDGQGVVRPAGTASWRDDPPCRCNSLVLFCRRGHIGPFGAYGDATRARPARASKCASVDRRGGPPYLARPLVPRRLKVRLRTLTPLIEVRILTGHPGYLQKSAD